MYKFSREGYVRPGGGEVCISLAEKLGCISLAERWLLLDV